MAAAIPLALGQASLSLTQAPLPQSVTDPKGRFTMTFPSDWEIVTHAEAKIALTGNGPFYAGSRPTINVVVEESLPEAMPPQDLAAAAEQGLKLMLHNYTVIRESNERVQGRLAYYRYFTWETNTGITMSVVQMFFTEGRTGFVITGGTINEPERVLHDMPVVNRIIETFQVTLAPANTNN
jgi:hypothetical protein